MDAVILDTDVYSYMHKPGDRRGEIYRKKVQGKLLCVSFITVGEVLFGKDRWGAARVERLRTSFKSFVIVPYDVAVCQAYADLKSRVEASGKKLADNDLWIAACAVRHSVPLVSNNRSHFEMVPGLILISEATVISEIQSQSEFFKKTSSEPEVPS